MNVIADLKRPALDLSFAHRGGQTVLAQRHVTYPFFITAPLRGRGAVAEIILQSISGGLFGDERVAQRIAVGENASVTLRMPSATIVHNRREKAAPTFTAALHAAEGARLQYLPRPTILLPGSALAQSLDVTVAPGATVLLQDGFLMHDPQGFTAATRALDSRITIRDPGGRLIALDRMAVTDADIGAGRYRAFGTLWLLHNMAISNSPSLKTALTDIPTDPLSVYWGLTRLRAESGLMIRLAARDGGDLDIALGTLRAALLSWVTQA